MCLFCNLDEKISIIPKKNIKSNLNHNFPKIWSSGESPFVTEESRESGVRISEAPSESFKLEVSNIPDLHNKAFKNQDMNGFIEGKFKHSNYIKWDLKP